MGDRGGSVGLGIGVKVGDRGWDWGGGEWIGSRDGIGDWGTGWGGQGLGCVRVFWVNG